MRYFLFLVLGAFSFTPASKAYASTFGCESVAGSVIFKDTVYGVLTGTILTGLYVLAQDKDKRHDTEQTLSSGAAIGGLLGFGLGVTEIALRECPSIRMGKAGFSSTFAALKNPNGDLASGWRVSWLF